MPEVGGLNRLERSLNYQMQSYLSSTLNPIAETMR